MPTAYHNGTIYTGTEVLRGMAVLVDEGYVTDVVPEDALPSHYVKENLNGCNIAPAFIDLQIYGAYGQLFSQDLSLAALQAVNEYCHAGGAGHFMITMATNSMDRFLDGIHAVKTYWAEGGKSLLGLHLEGPYLNPLKKGAHVERYIKRPTVEEVAWLLEKGKDVVRMITLAPEMCSDEVITMLLDNGIIVSAGHSNATYREALHGMDLGIPVATHLFNAMSPFQSREPGMVGAIYDHPTICSSIVCDGIHVDFAAARISKKILQERLFFITDAVTACREGEYIHVLDGGRYTLPDGTLSGSTLTMMKCVRNAVQHLDITLEEAIRMASTYPAQILGDSGLGMIRKGAKACFVVFDQSLEVLHVHLQ